MNVHTGFRLPDLTTSLPRAPFHFSPKAAEEAAAVIAGEPADIFRQLLGDQESETTLLVSRRILEAFLTAAHSESSAQPRTDADAIAVWLERTRTELAPYLIALREAAPETRELVLRQRAPLALLGGCWLDTVSQAATQPSVIVNRLFGQHFLLQGEGIPQRGQQARRRRALTELGVHLPEIEAADFLRQASARPLTVLHASFHLALSRLPASFLPEVVGVHYAMAALGIDDLLLGTEPHLPEAEARTVLADYLSLTDQSPTGDADRRRTLAAIALVLRLEREHTALLTELAAWHEGLSLDARVAQIVARHAPFAGRQHRSVRMGDRLLSDWLGSEPVDLAAFIAEFRASRQLRPGRDGTCRFLKSIKFGGPMFGIFDEREAATFTAWAHAVEAGEPADLDFAANTAGDDRADAWAEALRRTAPEDVVIADAESGLDDRRLFHRVVNVEQYPHILATARDRAEAGLTDAEILFTHGAGGRLTNAEYFDYTPEGLMERVERVYWDKLVDPYQPLTEIPDRDEVIFEQTTFALGSLIDGSWAHRIGNLGRNHRQSDAMLFGIYADEMGRGDVTKNHITLIHQVLASMDIHLPHIRQPEFLEQGDLPDHLYGFSIHQVCLSLFPDTFYNEILGYNLGIEMFGLGEMRLHEIQKLRRHKFDVSYEEAHLSIDNFSAGHARQSADIIVSYLDDVRRHSGDAAVQQEWRRIWRGYASFAYFVEHQLVKQVRAQERTPAASAPAPPDDVDLLI
ncbi:iron-containing redox enzyme family protein [Streptomyces sp. 11x1]|uniref:iron-containing redox enzyme family protein n=1 Tax=Streptomyces sp. 11x1 TaxID=3038642 RepID=UPI00293175DC|nr:iron-containing redox enzyme family protein [Streptomyces sp. 11x1]WNZ09568.1 iron-containing redox enzyme family protein [Streptomyces sp. 11x1]